MIGKHRLSDLLISLNPSTRRIFSSNFNRKNQQRRRVARTLPKRGRKQALSAGIKYKPPQVRIYLSRELGIKPEGILNNVEYQATPHISICSRKNRSVQAPGTGSIHVVHSNVCKLKQLQVWLVSLLKSALIISCRKAIKAHNLTTKHRKNCGQPQTK